MLNRTLIKYKRRKEFNKGKKNYSDIDKEIYGLGTVRENSKGH